jgi:metal-dependent amidase/aminoacylase/carboxypeptidase family protein
MKKKLAALTLALVMALSLAACGGGAATTEEATETEATEAASGANALAVCLASEPDTIDPALNSAVDGATMLIHLFSGLAKWEQDANGDLQIVPDAAQELTEGVVNDDGMTALVERSAAALLGVDRVHRLAEPTMTTEDFGYFLMQRPGSFYHVGAGCGLPLHNTGFLPDDGAAVVAAAVHAAVIEAFLRG